MAAAKVAAKTRNVFVFILVLLVLVFQPTSAWFFGVTGPRRFPSPKHAKGFEYFLKGPEGSRSAEKVAAVASKRRYDAPKLESLQRTTF